MHRRAGGERSLATAIEAFEKPRPTFQSHGAPLPSCNLLFRPLLRNYNTSFSARNGALTPLHAIQEADGANAQGEDIARVKTQRLGGSAASEAAPNFAAALEDPVGFVRVWAAAALAQVAPSGRELVAVPIAELGASINGAERVVVSAVKQRG